MASGAGWYFDNPATLSFGAGGLYPGVGQPQAARQLAHGLNSQQLGQRPAKRRRSGERDRQRPDPRERRSRRRAPYPRRTRWTH
ncbi:MAG: hypothetical protein WKG07_21265 [Hymenobacter sp.]